MHLKVVLMASLWHIRIPSITTLVLWGDCLMARFEAEFYEKENGEQPAREFLLSLDKKMRAKMMMIIGVLQDNGNEL